jgi:hypothetical protein
MADTTILSENYENREFMIFAVSEVLLIDFNQVYETSIDTMRKSIDGTKTFVKWEGQTPSSVLSLTTKEGPYTYQEIINILNGPDWAADAPLV